MKYCSECGGALEWQEVEGRKRWYCARCGKIFYEQLKVGAGCIVEKDGRILLIRRAKEPFQGEWNLPAGYVEVDESPAEAATREVLEETGLKVEAGELAGVYFFDDDPRGNGILVVYWSRVVDGKERETEEGEQVGYFSRTTIPNNLAGGGHDQAIRAWVRLQEEGEL